MVSAAIFDLDGTLVDSFDAHYKAFRDVFAEEGINFTVSEFRTYFGKLSSETFKQQMMLSGKDERNYDFKMMSARKQELFRRRYVMDVTALPGARQLLEKLLARGFKLAVASNSPRKNIDAMLNATDLTGFFREIISIDDVRKPKPDPEMFLLACQRLGCQPKDCIAFDDSVHGVKAAVAACTIAVAVLTGGARREDIEPLKPDHIIDCLDEALSLQLF